MMQKHNLFLSSRIIQRSDCAGMNGGQEIREGVGLSPGQGPGKVRGLQGRGMNGMWGCHTATAPKVKDRHERTNTLQTHCHDH